MIEVIEHLGIRYAEIIRSDLKVEKTRFFSPAESSFQFGLLAHEAGYKEPAHYHQEFERTVKDLQQMFIVQRGVVAVQLFDDEGKLLKEVVLNPGDAIVLIHGAHAIRVIEDMQCISVKQGPFLGDAFDKIIIKTK
jgi:anti-sigma factor ChrR (cupin superfamily)